MSSLLPSPSCTSHRIACLLSPPWLCLPPLPQVLAARGHVQLLELPASIFKPELQPFVAALFRHILEDPVTLQVGGRWWQWGGSVWGGAEGGLRGLQQQRSAPFCRSPPPLQVGGLGRGWFTILPPTSAPPNEWLAAPLFSTTWLLCSWPRHPAPRPSY